MMDREKMLKDCADELRETFKGSKRICDATEKVLYLMQGGSREEADKMWPELSHNEIW